MAIYFFYGEEDYNIEQEVEKLKKGLDKNFLEMSFKTYDCPKFPDLISILRSQPMMFGKMLIVINCLDYFSKAFDEKELKEISSNAKVTAKDAEIAARDAAKLVNSKQFKKQIADAEKAAKNAKKLVNSKEYQQQIKDAQKAAEEATKSGNKSKVIILNSSGKGDGNMKIYIDGKEVSKSEMERFPPEKIEKMEVNKKGYLGKKNAEIHITTKK